MEIQESIIYYAREKLLEGVAFPHTTQDKIKTLTLDVKLGKSCIVLMQSWSACMAVCLVLEFNATMLVSQDQERTQIKKHMQICLMMNPGFKTLSLLLLQNCFK